MFLFRYREYLLSPDCSPKNKHYRRSVRHQPPAVLCSVRQYKHATQQTQELSRTNTIFSRSQTSAMLPPTFNNWFCFTLLMLHDEHSLSSFIGLFWKNCRLRIHSSIPCRGIASITSRTVLAPHPASYSASNQTLPPGVVRRPGREADHLLTRRVEVKGCNHTSIPPYAFMECTGASSPFYFRLCCGKQHGLWFLFCRIKKLGNVCIA